MMKRLTLALGTERLRAIFILLATTGLISLILNAVQGDWVRPVQTILAIVFITGSMVIIGGKLSWEDRIRYIQIFAPAFGAVVLALTVLQNISLLLLGLAFGWILAGLFIFGNVRAPMQYKETVKHLRKNNYAEAVKTLDDLIKEEPTVSHHYRFRAEILRLWGKFDRARRDYRKIIELEPQSAVGYNGLAEVYLQENNFTSAREAALTAFELASTEWVTAYNLGMIEDRLKLSQEVIDHLRIALKLKVPDARHRLLIHLYLTRAYSRMGNMEAAKHEVKSLARHQGGLNEWQVLLQSDQAQTLRDVIEDDVKTAEALIDGSIDVLALKGNP
jgi:tetratricopeptide (TPR) repeat protein